MNPQFDDNFDIQRQLEHFENDMNLTLDLTLCMLHALSFRLKIFYLIQTLIHVGMSTLKKTTKMGQ